MWLRVYFIRFFASLLVTGIGVQLLSGQLQAIQFVPPQTDETSDPRDRPRGGGARPICDPPHALPCIDAAMVALVPSSNPIGMTLTPTPQLWFFSPYDSEIPLQASFELVDAQGQIVWQESDIELVSQPSIFSYQIPAEARLKANQTYRWYLSVHLEPEQPASDVLLSARLIYKDNLQIFGNDLVDNAQLLAEQGIWYDLVTTLTQLQRSERSLWESFLLEYGFPDLVDYPIHGNASAYVESP